MDIFVGRNESVQQPVMDDLNKFIDFLSSLLTTCEKVKVDMQTVKRDLLRAKTEAVALKAKAVEDRTVLAAANITFGLAAAVSIFSGGLALPILLGTGQLMTTICANEVNKHYNNRVMQIIRAVDHRSENATHRARAVINKRNAYKSTINRLQLSGIDENLAIFYAVCASINEFNNQESNTIDDYMPIMDDEAMHNQSLMERFSNHRSIGFAGLSLASSETEIFASYAPEWLSNVSKRLSDKIPKFGAQLAASATTVIAAGVEVIYAIRFACKKNEALEVIDETTNLLDDGVNSLDVFIDAFTALRIQALHEERERQVEIKRQALQEERERQREIKQMELKRIRLENAKYVTIVAFGFGLFMAMILMLLIKF